MEMLKKRVPAEPFITAASKKRRNLVIHPGIHTHSELVHILLSLSESDRANEQKTEIANDHKNYFPIGTCRHTQRATENVFMYFVMSTHCRTASHPFPCAYAHIWVKSSKPGMYGPNKAGM